MVNRKIVSSFLKKEGIYPQTDDAASCGLRLRVETGQLLLQGTASDLIDLADLLVSLALSGEAQGQHWHIDDLTLMDEASEIPELILEKTGG